MTDTEVGSEGGDTEVWSRHEQFTVHIYHHALVDTPVCGDKRRMEAVRANVERSERGRQRIHGKVEVLVQQEGSEGERRSGEGLKDTGEVLTPKDKHFGGRRRDGVE